MKAIRVGVATSVIALLMACASAPQQDYGAHPTEVNVTNNPGRRFGEMQLAVNPRDPNNIVMAVVSLGTSTACFANHDPMCDTVPATLAPGIRIPQPRGFFERDDFNLVVAYVSFDRGRTWQAHAMPSHPEGLPGLTGQGDPSVTVGPDGAFYVSWDANDWGTADHALPAAGVAVSASKDGGRTWSTPHLTGTPVDGPKLTADLSDGRIYAASSTFLGPHSTGDADSPPNPVNARWIASTPDGIHWSTPQPMGGSGGMHVAAHGMLATAFQASSNRATGMAAMFSTSNGELCGASPQPCTIFQTSTDAGAHWTRHVVATPSDYGGGQGGGIMVAADPSQRGHFALAILRNNKGEFDVYETRNAGATWTGPAIVTEDASRVHVLPWLAYSPEGVLGILWRTRQPEPGASQTPTGPFGQLPSAPYNVWAAVSRNGGARFSQPLQLSSANSPASPPGPFGDAGDDYSALVLDGDYLYAGWADWRPGDRQNFFSAVRLDAFRP